MRLGNKGFGRIFGLNSATRASKSSKYFQVLSGKKLWRIFLQRTSNQPRICQRLVLFVQQRFLLLQVFPWKNSSFVLVRYKTQ